MKTDVEPSGAFAIWLHLFTVQEGVCFSKWKVRPWNISSRGQSIRFRQCSGVSNKTTVVDSSVSMFFYILGIHSFEMYGVVLQKWRLQTCFQNSTKKSYYDVWWLFACPFADNSICLSSNRRGFWMSSLQVSWSPNGKFIVFVSGRTKICQFNAYFDSESDGRGHSNLGFWQHWLQGQVLDPAE